VQNNGIEGTNTHVKGPDGTFRERLGVLQFLKELEEGFVKRWSLERNPIVKFPDGREETNLNLKKFYHEPLFELSDLTTACQWGKLGKSFRKFKDTYETLYYCTPGIDENGKEIKNLTIGDCEDFFEKREFSDWSSFDEFIKHSRRIRFVKINTENFKLSTCSCWYWCKYYKCKHMIDLCSRLGHITYDSKVRQIPIGQNRRRGRPKDTVSALEIQPSEEQGVFSADSESDLDESQEITKKKGRKKKVTTKDSDESDESNESDFDIFDDEKVRREIKSTKVAKSKTLQTSSNTQPPPPPSNTNNPPNCPTCNNPMKKKKGFYCPNKCNKK
jgi:hypothetical protein